MSVDVEQYLDAQENKQLLKFITCGSVDDGKSTLIGRMLYESQLILDDQLSELNLKKGEKFTICRFVSWEANHDYGHSGLSTKNKITAVKEFSKYGKVFITSENELPEELKQYQIKLPPEKIHHAISFASLLYGESSTMASEAAVLGTPAIFIDDIGRGYTDEQESNYEIVYNFTESIKIKYNQ